MLRPRVIVGLLGIDQHDVGAITVAALLRDAGMEVIYAGRYNTPAGLVRMAVEEDADIIGISCHSWEYLAYVPELLFMIRDQQLDVSVVLGGSVITSTDAAAMHDVGVDAVFGPAHTPDRIVQELRTLAERRHERLREASAVPPQPTPPRNT